MVGVGEAIGLVEGNPEEKERREDWDLGTGNLYMDAGVTCGGHLLTECRTEHLMNCHVVIIFSSEEAWVQLEYFWLATLAAEKGAGLHPN